MEEKIKNISKRIKLHLIHTEKFKTNLVASFILVDLKKEDITKNALIPAVLKRGTTKYPTMSDISNYMDDLYGAIFDASSDKLGSKQALQFYISCIDDEFALNNERILENSIDFLANVMFEPKTNGGKFNKEYVEQEKEQLRELIKGRINDKASYAINRTLEEAFPNDAYGVYKYGREEDLNDINEENLYKQYLKVLKDGSIHFYVVGKFNEEEITSKFISMCAKLEFLKDEVLEEKFEEDSLSKNENIYDAVTINRSDLDLISEVKKVNDTLDVVQGKLVLLYDVQIDPFSDDLYKEYVYNAILGSSVTSKLFQNVREKNSMAYTIRSMYVKHRAIMLITAGIEMDKYDKALELIKIEVDDMRKGNFSEDDIKNAKVFLENTYKSYTDDATTMVSLSMGQNLLKMDFDVDEMIEKINGVTREDIMDIANKTILKLEYYLGN